MAFYGNIDRRARLPEVIDLLNAYPPGAQRVIDPRDPTYGAVGDGVTDDTAAILAALADAESDSEHAMAILDLPPGRYRLTAPLVFRKQYVHIRGHGMHASELYFDLTTGASYITTHADLAYLRPILTNFRVTGGVSATGHGIDFTPIGVSYPGGQMYNGEFSRLWINSQGACVYGEHVFSFLFSHLYGQSALDHCFRVHCGNSVQWQNCYAVTCPATKAGYRLSGGIHMIACNGLSSGGWWGIFGLDPAAADGYENDFPSLGGSSYPEVHLDNCNIEEFTVGGIKLHAEYVRCFISGKIDRNGPTSGYHSLVHARKRGYVVGTPVRLNVRVFPGTGIPNGGAALTAGHLVTDGSAVFEDQAGTLYDAGVTKFYDGSAGIYYPLRRDTYRADVYGDTARWFDAVGARRLSVETLRYATPAALTPVGADQTIDVTGYTKVTVTPAAAASIARATFNATAGTGAPTDHGRNGDLLIEAGNGNLTIKHNVAGTGGFRLKAGTNATMASGEVRRFVWSANYTAGVGGWVEA